MTIYKKILIGNSLIIIIGAIFGTLITRHLTSIAVDLWLIIFFAVTGTTISVCANIIILNSTLKPLIALRKLVGNIQLHSTNIGTNNIHKDSDIDQLSYALNYLLIQLSDRNKQLQIMSERAINAQEDERKRIARSLHDDTGQALTSIAINLDILNKHLIKLDDGLREKLTTTKALTINSIKGLKIIINDLRPSLLDDLGLIAAIRWHARSRLEEAGINVEIISQETINDISPQITITLFRVLQESINNIIKHSKAQNVTIEVNNSNDHLKLSIIDDGQGFDVNFQNQIGSLRQQWGIIGIKERLDIIGGILNITSSSDNGTTLLITVPKYKNSE